MTRTQHYSHPTRAFPVYCLGWTDDSTVVLGGGGGATKSGIGNKLKLCKVTRDGRKLEQAFELALSNDEDAPMTMALDRPSSQLVTGINASQASVEGGKNDQCRIFSYADSQVAFVRSQGTINAAWSDDYPYQKFTALSVPQKEGASASYLAIGTTEDKVTVLAFPSLEVLVSPFAVEGGDLQDVDWGGPEGTWLLVATASKLNVYSFDGTALHLLQTLDAPRSEDSQLTFRGVRFLPGTPSRPSILAALNSLGPSRREARRKARKSYIAKYDPPGPAADAASSEKAADDASEKTPLPAPTSMTWSLATKREVSNKPITVFDVSSNGRLVAFGCADLSIGMLDAHTLAPLLKILQAHSFPPTALKFNPSATMLMSASADNTVRTVIVPASFGASLPSTAVMLILAILIVLIAFLLRK